MSIMTVTFEEKLRCRLKTERGKEIVTDAPAENNGLAEYISPTDLAAGSVGLCMLSVMGIAAERHGIDLKGSTAEVSKKMVHAPAYRIGEMTIDFKMAKGIDPSKRVLLEKTARACPVGNSFHPDTKMILNFQYPD